MFSNEQKIWSKLFEVLTSVGMRACSGPFEDDEGCCSHFDGAVARLPAGNTESKRMRVDLLTSVAKGLREVAAFKQEFEVSH